MAEKVKILDSQEVAKGIKLCLDNAKALVEEAEILHNNNRYRGSLVLALFAWEECAKISQIFNLLEPVNKENLKKEWKEFYWEKFRSHESKLIGGFANKIIRDINETGGNNIGKLAKGKPAKDKSTLVSIKESCLYVNCDFTERKFIEPSQISEDFSAEIIKDVKNEINIYKLFDNNTIKEIKKALELHAGDGYWESRPFEKDSKIIKDKLEQIYKSRFKESTKTVT